MVSEVGRGVRPAQVAAQRTGHRQEVQRLVHEEEALLVMLRHLEDSEAAVGLAQLILRHALLINLSADLLVLVVREQVVAELVEVALQLFL